MALINASVLIGIEVNISLDAGNPFVNIALDLRFESA
jgi:hypothetical protein